MLFNSFSFAIFLPVVFAIYWFLLKDKLKAQNVLLLIASYYFYSCWDYRFLFLLIFSTFLDYFTGLKISNSNSQYYKKIWLFISLFVNFGFLAVFKYYDFFVSSFIELLSNLGVNASYVPLNIILPVGISFYTFHGISYVFDIYKGRIEYEKNIVDYSLFVSFFPLLVAGPIERATHLLPQIKIKREFNYDKLVDGLRQMLWGFFKKIVIADNCAEYANEIFANHSTLDGTTLIFGAVLFSVQIYCDFSGYSDIALGVARLFGIELLRNFAFPYFSRDIAEFWRRWHISLSSWFKDYLYIPLGGSKGTMLSKVRNTFIIFIVSGFWHGANWTFVIWGLLNALYILPLIIFDLNRNNLEIVSKNKILPSISDFFKIILTFSLTVFAWIFFRSENVASAFSYIAKIFTSTHLFVPEIFPKYLILLISFMFGIEWIARENKYGLEKIGLNWPWFLRYSFYYLIVFLIIFNGGEEQEFIYFQF
jgi:alginate O-acetyltransferase complex protein AlgI